MKNLKTTLEKLSERKRVELLLPVGQKEMALAAIHNGADAIFVGMPKFNARGRSHDFSLDEMRDLIETCHLYGVKVNIAFNILIFENELEPAIEILQKVLELKPDALIVQDLGLVRLIREIAPDQVIHASTQMTVTNELAIELLQDLKMRRFVLGRENSLAEIKMIAERSKAELEIFVHGALCVSYSGQCFTSENLGGRSANRGQCAQSCRLSYDLYVDGEKYKDIDEKFLVSPQDLCGIAEVPELMKLGVKSFKVEGRLKTPEYVGSVAESFNKAIWSVLQNQPLSERELKAEKFKMAIPYSRGFFPGWLHGVSHQKLVDGHFNSHRGALLGQVVGAKSNALQVRLDEDFPIQPGDGILWATGSKETEMGSYVYSVSPSSEKTVWIGIENGKFPTIHEQDGVKGALIYLNHSKSFSHQIHLQKVDRNSQKKIPIEMLVEVKVGQKVRMQVSDGRFAVEGFSDLEVTRAQKRPLDIENIKVELASLGGTVFCLLDVDDLQIELDAEAFLPMSEFKKLRQRLVSELELQRKSHRIEFLPEAQPSRTQTVGPAASLSQSRPLQIQMKAPQLTLLLRDKFQVRVFREAILSGRLRAEDIDSVILDFEFGRDYSESVQAVKDLGLRVGIATTRILKPQEYQNLKNIFNLKPDIILVRNLGALHYFQSVQVFQGQLFGDFSLNAANSKTVDYLLGKGLDRLTISYDLNAHQVSDLLSAVRKSHQADALSRLEVTLHQSMPSFHMEHCVFAAFLSEGSSYKDCGKPCEKHEVKLKDQLGNWHYIKPDQECRNTMYNAVSQTAISFFESWKSLGLKNIRYEALRETGEELIQRVENYILFLKGEIELQATLARISATESYGLSPGNLEKEHQFQSRKKFAPNEPDSPISK